MPGGDHHYCSTFIAGFGEVVVDALTRTLSDVVVEALFDGLVIYRTSAPVSAIQSLRFCNNSFLLLRWEQCASEQKPEQIIQRLFAKANIGRAASVTSARSVRTFRIFVSKENSTIAVDPTVLTALEREIAQQLRLTVNRALPDVEFWFLLRSEKICLFGLRVTAIGRQRTRKYARGELRQELAHLLCWLSEPGGHDRFLDPFCGSGALVLERLQAFPYKQILAGDSDPAHVAALRRKTRQAKNVQVEQWDARHLTKLASESVTKIVTDPPWGFFRDETIDFVTFYTEILTEFARVLQPGGVAVILVGRKEEFERALATAGLRLHLRKKYDVLVSGKKAGVYQCVCDSPALP
jgi:23S rRNA G2445 N2-methylase RlmL